MTYYSQFGEDQWIFEHLFPPVGGMFAEIGAYDGVASSNTAFFERFLGWTGLLIEPNPKQWMKCRENRMSPSLCLAIGTDCGDRPFYINDQDEGASGLRVMGRPMYQLVTTFSSLWNCFFPTQQPWMLSIDTEGTEIDAWKSVWPLEPKVVIMEHLSLPGASRADEIVAVMKAGGYKEVHRTFANLIFVRENSDRISNPS